LIAEENALTALLQRGYIADKDVLSIVA